MNTGVKKKIIYSEEVDDFLSSLSARAKRKILYNISRVAGGEIDNELFKKIDDDGIWEFRTEFEGLWYRILAFWDTRTDTIIVTTHGFSKKKNKTPAKEIARAKAIMQEYFNQ